MRIQLLSINYAPERTGIGPYSTALARHLSQSHDVTVITGVPHYPDWEVPLAHRRWRSEQIEGSLRVISLQHYVPRSPGVIGRLAYELSWAVRAAVVGRRIPADVVIAVVPALFAAHAARLIRRKINAPVGVLVQDIMGAAAAQSGAKGGSAVAGLAAAVERVGLQKANSIATIHPRLAAELSRLSGRPEPAEVIYNWVHVDQPRTPQRMARQRYGWSDDEIIALHSGNMGAKQNLEVVIDAARLARDTKPFVRFVLAGGGSQRAGLQRYGAGVPNLEFLGSVPNDEYADLLSAADILLLNERPGMREMSLPSKLTSYLHAGRPVVAATDPGSASADFIRASGGGVLTPAGDSAALLQAVMDLAADPDLCVNCTTAGKAFAAGNLSQEKALAAYDAWVEDVANHRHTRTLVELPSA